METYSPLTDIIDEKISPTVIKIGKNKEGTDKYATTLNLTKAVINGDVLEIMQKVLFSWVTDPIIGEKLDITPSEWEFTKTNYLDSRGQQQEGTWIRKINKSQKLYNFHSLNN